MHHLHAHTLPLLLTCTHITHSLSSSHTLYFLLSSVDMSRDALHEAVFGMLEQYQEEPVPYAYHSQEPPPYMHSSQEPGPYMHSSQEPGPPGYTSCEEAPNGMAFPYQLTATNNTGLVTPGNQTTPSQSTVNVPARSGHRPVSASWSSAPLNGRFIEMSRITIGELIRQGVGVGVGVGVCVGCMCGVCVRVCVCVCLSVCVSGWG